LFLLYPDEYGRDQLSASGLDYVSLVQRESGTDDTNQFRTLDLTTWEEVFEQCTRGPGDLPYPLTSSTLHVGDGTATAGDYNENFSQLLDVGVGLTSELGEALTSYSSQVTCPVMMHVLEQICFMPFEAQATTNRTWEARWPLGAGKSRNVG